MFIVYTDKNKAKLKEAKEFSLVGNYILLDKKYLLGEEGGWIHISQLLEKTEEKPDINKY